MAKSVDVAITAGGGGTPVTYSLERQINSGGYSVVDGSIAYTGSPQTFVDTNGGSGFSDSDVVDYRATATNADGTSSASSVQQITISGAAATLTFSTLNNMTESPTGTFASDGTGGTYLTSYAVSNETFAGAFDIEFDYNDSAVGVKCMLCCSTDGTNQGYTSDSARNGLFLTGINAADVVVAGTNGTPNGTDSYTTVQSGSARGRLVRDGSNNLKAFVMGHPLPADYEVHDFGTVAGTMYIHIAVGSLTTTINPTLV